MSGQIPSIKEAGTTRRCSFSILLTFRMATTAFICDVNDSEGSVDSHQIKQKVRSYTLLQVLVGVLAVLVLALTGCFIWMMCSQNYSEKVWAVKFNGTDTNFISPESKEYVIFGNVFTEENPTDGKHNFRLVRKLPKQNHSEICKTPNREVVITSQNINAVFIVTAKLEKGTGLSICLNIKEMKIDEEKSILVVH